MDQPPGSLDVLRQPTRARIFDVLSELRRPAGTEELARRVGIHPNGARRHLAQLEVAGLVRRRRAGAARGRPRHEWTVSPEARPGGRRPESYRDLARWLARVASTAPAALAAVERSGCEIGRQIAPPPPSAGGSTSTALADAFAALGFEPEISEGAGGAFSCTLGNCPYREAADENQAVVCTLHRGITRGMLEVLDPDATLVDFAPGDPDAAGCLIEVAGIDAGREEEFVGV